MLVIRTGFHDIVDFHKIYGFIKLLCGLIFTLPVYASFYLTQSGVFFPKLLT